MRRLHRPAVSYGSITMTSVCGLRGPIRSVASLVSLPIQIDDECHQCAVLWDEAETEGRIEKRWIQNGKVSWRSGGAILWIERPWTFRRDSEPTFVRYDVEVLVVVRRKL